MADPTLSHVLLVLRVRGVAPSAAIAERAELPTAVVDEVLGSALDAGWVTQSSGRLAGWSLSAAGRRHGEQLLAEQVDSAGLRTELESVYEHFLGLNGELLSICTDWQVVRVDGAEVLNDHADAARDRAVLARLEQLHGAAAPLTDRLAIAARALLRVLARGCRPPADGSQRGSTSGSPGRRSIRTTRCGSSCTRTCSPPWVAPAPRNVAPDTTSRPSHRQRTRSTHEPQHRSSCHCDGHPVRRAWRPGSGRCGGAGELAGGERQRRPGAGRDHRREPDPDRVRGAGAVPHRPGRRLGPGRRWSRVELHRQRRRADAPGERDGRGCHPVGRAVLQPPVAGRPGGALPRRGRRDRPAGHPVRHPWKDRSQDLHRDHPRSRARRAQHRRAQGCRRRPRRDRPCHRAAHLRASRCTAATTR